MSKKVCLREGSRPIIQVSSASSTGRERVISYNSSSRTSQPVSFDAGPSTAFGTTVSDFTGSQVGNPDIDYGYRLRNHSIERSDDGASFQPVTSDQLVIKELTFYVTGTDDTDDKQSRVLITIAGTAGAGDEAKSFSLQTTITQRLLYSPRS